MKNVLCGVAGSGYSENSLQSTLKCMVSAANGGECPGLTVASMAGMGLAAATNRSEAEATAEGDMIAAYCGAPYWNDKDLATSHDTSGFAASLVEAYGRYGTQLLERLKGSFAIAVTDTGQGETLLAIDRIGIQQLYFGVTTSSELVFATSPKCVTAHRHFQARINDQAIFHYLYFHMVPSPDVVFEGQEKLGPGQYLLHRDNKVEKQTYWVPTFDERSSSSRPEMESEVRGLMRQAVSRCASSGQVGAFLSGGIDSSTIAGILADSHRPARTFTIGFREEGYDETSFARVTADHFQTTQKEYFVSAQDVVDVLPVIASYYDEPFGNSSVVPTYFCAKMAYDAGVQTMLGGDGGDELFAGNVRYVTQQVFAMYDRIPEFFRRLVMEPLAFGIPGADRFPPTRKAQSYISQAKLPMPERLETYNFIYRSGAHSILHEEFLSKVDIERPIADMHQTYDAVPDATMLNRMLHLDWKYTLADNDLRKVGTMCDLAGVGIRYPFLDDDVVEFSTRVPSRQKINRFRLRHFFKQAMRDYLPKEVLTKSKHGFGLPFGVWMQQYKPLQELSYDCLADIRKRNIINPEYLGQLIEAHRGTHAHYYGEFIWVLVMLELWLRTHCGAGAIADAALEGGQV